MKAEWWRNALVYEIYPRSFRDSDGDGVGDIAGMAQQLPYLRDLGVDAVWVTPWYRSPMADGGYDISDHRAIDPLYGTITDARAFIERAHATGIRVLIDIVPNHASDRHPWFAAALASPSGSVERSRFWFATGRGERPPNNWRSVFGGSAWTRSPHDRTGEWYLHLLAPEQPDVNWTSDDVRKDFLATMRFWLDVGVDGFRIDVAHGMSKHPDLLDLPEVVQTSASALDPLEVSGADVWIDHPHWDRDETHEIFRQWRALLDERSSPGEEKVLVAEAWRLRPGGLARYLEPDQLHTAFNLHFLGMEWSATDVAHRVSEHLRLLGTVGAPPTWVLGSHDITRVISRLGVALPWSQRRTEESSGTVDLHVGLRRARAAAMLTLALPGGCYIYQGEELGLPEIEDLPDAGLTDPIWERSGHTVRGRDGCRVPIPWTPDAPWFGFSDSRSWLPLPEGWGTLSVSVQENDPNSMLSLYRSAIRIRRDARDVVPADLDLLSAADDVLRFNRGPWECILTFSAAPPVLLDPCASVMLSSTPLREHTVEPDTCVWLWNRARA